MSTTILHIKKPKKDVLDAFLKLQIEKEEKIKAIRKTTYSSYKKI